MKLSVPRLWEEARKEELIMIQIIAPEAVRVRVSGFEKERKKWGLCGLDNKMAYLSYMLCMVSF
jgi:hypothetical protein